MPSIQLQIPPVGAFRTDDHRYFLNGAGPVPSVTSVLKILDKPALSWWYRANVAWAAINHADWLPMILDAIGSEQTMLWLASMPDAERDTAATIGTGIHLLADLQGASSVPLTADQAAAAGFSLSDDVQPYLAAFRGFMDWLSASDGRIVSSEHFVFGDGYAGTYDLICQIDGQLWLLDLKSGKHGNYPEYALQLSGYANANGIALPDDPVLYPMPKIDRVGVLHLRPDRYAKGWALIEYGIGHRDQVAFLAALELYQWRKEGRFTKLQPMA